MSKKQRAKPEEPETVPAIIEAPVAEVASAAIPTPPPIIQGLSRIPTLRWGVPEWLVRMAAWTGSQYGASVPGRANYCGITSVGTMPKTEDGFAWFGNPKIGMDQFGQVCHSLGLDYSDPKGCVEKLKARCPKIDTASYTLFTEAK